MFSGLCGAFGNRSDNEKRCASGAAITGTMRKQKQQEKSFEYSCRLRGSESVLNMQLLYV